MDHRKEIGDSDSQTFWLSFHIGKIFVGMQGINKWLTIASQCSSLQTMDQHRFRKGKPFMYFPASSIINSLWAYVSRSSWLSLPDIHGQWKSSNAFLWLPPNRLSWWSLASKYSFPAFIAVGLDTYSSRWVCFTTIEVNQMSDSWYVLHNARRGMGSCTTSPLHSKAAR